MSAGSSDPDWLIWAREIQAVAQTGLAFSQDPYDLDRYTALTRLSARIMAEHTMADVGRIEGLFASETGYATPKLGVRAAVFDATGRILMVRETVDAGRWTLPGGWADVNQTPAQSVVREVLEESGYHVRAVKLAAVWDRASRRSRRRHFPWRGCSLSVCRRVARHDPVWKPARSAGSRRQKSLPICH